jgi:hypothetical protein
MDGLPNRIAVTDAPPKPEGDALRLCDRRNRSGISARAEKRRLARRKLRPRLRRSFLDGEASAP